MGYRWHDTKKIPAAWPFGYGLSYTTFAIGGKACGNRKVSVDKAVCQASDTLFVTVPVCNTGTRDGAEVIQVYVSDPKCSVPRPAKELKAFQKLYLKAGEMGEAKLALPVASFAFWNEGWQLEPGEYRLLVGNSSAKPAAVLTVKLM